VEGPLRPDKGDVMVDDILEAVIVSEAVDFFTPGGVSRKVRRWALGGLVAVGIVALLVSQILTSSLMGQIAGNDIDEYPPIWERHLIDFVTDDAHSYVLSNGSLTGPNGESLWSGTHHFVEFELPLEEGGAAPNGKVSLAVWIPLVEEGVTVPVIAEFGPYFDEASVSTPGIEEAWNLAR
jgi:hypothetical protein